MVLPECKEAESKSEGEPAPKPAAAALEVLVLSMAIKQKLQCTARSAVMRSYCGAVISP